MCKYCEQKKDGSWRGQTRYGKDWYLHLYEKQKWLVVTGHNFCRAYVPIKYCPHCGKKL